MESSRWPVKARHRSSWNARSSARSSSRTTRQQVTPMHKQAARLERSADLLRSELTEEIIAMIHYGSSNGLGGAVEPVAGEVFDRLAEGGEQPSIAELLAAHHSLKVLIAPGHPGGRPHLLPDARRARAAARAARHDPAPVAGEPPVHAAVLRDERLGADQLRDDPAQRLRAERRAATVQAPVHHRRLGHRRELRRALRGLGGRSAAPLRPGDGELLLAADRPRGGGRDHPHRDRPDRRARPRTRRASRLRSSPSRAASRRGCFTWCSRAW